MRTLNNAVLALENKKNAFMQYMNTLALTKKAGDSGTIASLILIVIVVGLLITFKTAASGWVQTLIGYFNSALSNFTL